MNILTLTPEQSLIFNKSQPDPTSIELRTWLQQFELTSLTLATPAQTHELWKQAIAAHETHLVHQAHLSNNALNHLAHSAQAAWFFLQLSHEKNPLSAATSFFIPIAQAFQDALHSHHWRDETLALKTAITHAKPEWMLGHDTLPPLLKKWAKPFRPLNTQTPLETHYAYLDEKHELQAMMLFAKQCVEEEKTLTCIVPNLQKHRITIERLLCRTFKDHTPFQIVQSTPLSTQPLIGSALLGLKFLNDYLNPDEFTQFLHSSFFEHVLDPLTFIYDQQRRQIPCTHYTHLPQAPLASILKKNVEAAQQLPRVKVALAGEWAIHYQQQLKKLGFLTPASLEETPIFYQFEKACEEFSSLSSLLGKLTAPEALTQFSELLSTIKIISPPTESSILIIDAIDVFSLTAETVWFFKTHNFQQKTILNPFLKPHQQQIYPAHSILNYLKNITKTIFYTYPQTVDEDIQHPCSLITIPCQHITENNLPSLLKTTHTLQKKTEPATYVPPTATHLKGGSHYFKDHVACPFRAFARYRLQAKTMDIPSRYIQPVLRGILTHAVLEEFWRLTHNQATLLALNTFQLHERVETCITKAMNKQAIFASRFRQLEEERLKQRILLWLEYEKKRHPFRVKSIEQPTEIILETLQFSITMDRIDEIDNGNGIPRTLLIDYKTGDASPLKWFGERPDEPQLLCYIMTNEYHIDAIAYALLKRPEVKLQGLTCDRQLLPELREPPGADEQGAELAWEHLKQTWQNNLNALAKEIKQGFIGIVPKDGEATCQCCNLHTLCRIREQ